MALPTSASTSWLPQRSGVRGMFFSSDPSLGVQVELSSANTTSSSKWTARRYTASAAARLGGAYAWEVPLSTKAWFMRAKTWKLGQTDSVYSTVLSLKPQSLNAILPPPSAEARRLTQFGAFTTASARVFRVPFAAFIAADNSQKWKHSTAGWVQPNSTGAARVVASMVLPPGVTITGISGRFFRTNITDTITFRLGRLGESGSITGLSTMIQSGGGVGVWVTSTQSLGESVTSTKSYVVRVDFSASAASSNQRVARFDVSYTRPSLDRNY